MFHRPTHQVSCSGLVRVVTTGNLSIKLYTHAVLDEILWQVHPLHNLDAGPNNGLVLLVAHGAEQVNPSDTHPVQRIRHHGLKAGVPDSCNGLGVVEVHVWSIAALLVDPSIVDPELDHLPQAPALLAVVDHNAHAPSLRALHGLLESKDKVGPAAADVRAEDIGANALVVHPHRHLRLLVPQLSCIPEGVDGEATHRRQVGLHLRIQQAVVVGVLVQCLPQLLLGQTHTGRQELQVPGVGNGALRGDDLPARQNNLPVLLQLLQLGDVQLGLARGDGGGVRHHAQGIEGGDAVPVPLGLGVVRQLLELRQVELRLCAGLVPLLEVQPSLGLRDAPVGRVVPAIASGVEPRFQVVMHALPAVARGRVVAACLRFQVLAAATRSVAAAASRLTAGADVATQLRDTAAG
mmetsp:Transcript_105652/g.251951  ORF Transcript_105652/g.251951 Transcript_105652/m.251951 type:complete len:407 (-) Transcript_105652:51-1271(-)